MKTKQPKTRKVTKTRRSFPRVKTSVKAGPTRRAELDHVGAYNFMVEISGVAAG